MSAQGGRANEAQAGNSMAVDSSQNRENPPNNPNAIKPEEMRAIIDAMKNGVNHFSQEMFGETRNEDAQIAVAGPMLYLMARVMGVSLDSEGGSSRQTRLTPDRKPRDPVGNKENSIMRVWMKDYWEKKRYPAPVEEGVRRLFELLKKRDLWRDQRHYLYVEPFEELWRQSIPSDRGIGFSEGKSSADKAWNRATAAYVVKHHLIPIMNSATFQQRVRVWEEDLEWDNEMIGRVTSHVDYIFDKRRKDSQRKEEEKQKRKYAEARVREYDRRVQVARQNGWRKVESGLRKLGHDGMSSDEEEEPLAIPRREHVRAIHHHPWRSRDATAMIRQVAEAVEQASAAKGRRGNVKNVRNITAKTADPRSSRRLHQPVPDLLPDNFYYWDLLRNRAFHKNLNIEGGASAMRVLRPTDETDELLLENFTELNVAA
ncbi:hypothetical protein AAF712_012401 [Marasmius tenuissimus]|uniref:Uncharacterized protein n=1 Tax=Marasmius tenuissimus TaxID=585030 RepID=A0ABR2ZHM2_9AGAR